MFMRIRQDVATVSRSTGMEAVWWKRFAGSQKNLVGRGGGMHKKDWLVCLLGGCRAIMFKCGHGNMGAVGCLSLLFDDESGSGGLECY